LSVTVIGVFPECTASPPAFEILTAAFSGTLATVMV
jgi:hypothetical protein